MKNIEKLDFLGDPNIGFYAIANNEISIIGDKINKREVEKTLKVKCFRLKANNTSLVGLFLSMNSNGLIAPDILLDEEISRLKEIAKQFSMNFLILKTKYTALNNLILANDKGCIISRNFTKREAKKIEDCLNVETIRMDIYGFKIVGSVGVANNNGCVVHRDTNDDELKKIEEILKVDVETSTVNFGSPFVASGIIANDKGILVGSKTTGPELAIIYDTLKG